MDAAAYRQFSTEQKRGEMELLAHMNFTGSGTLLDIGCGEGRITAEIAGSLSSWIVTGLDPNEEMLTLAKASFDHPNLGFTHGTLDQLPEDATFDAITLFNALHLIPDCEDFLAAIKRRLNPDGQLLILTHPLDSSAAQIIRKTLLDPQWAGNIRHDVITARRYLSQYEQTLDELGFQTVFRETYPSERYAESPEKLTEVMSMALPLFGSFEPAERQRCAEAVTQALGETRFELLTFAYIGRK